MKKLISLLLTISIILSLVTAIPVQAASYNESSYTLTGVQVNDIVEIARTQSGYHEGDNSSQLDGTFYGTGNYTKYARDLANAGYGASNPNAWCAYFVSWCAMKAGCLNSAVSYFTGVNTCVARSRPYNSNGRGTYHGIKKHTFTGDTFSKGYYTPSTENYTPKKGDIMVNKSHIGLVISDYNPSANSFTVIDGNNNNMVRSPRTVYLNNSELVGFITPDYITTTVTPSHTHSYSYSHDTTHPHLEFKYCSCGTKEYTGNKIAVSSCTQCYPVGNVNLTRSFEKTKGTATFYRNNVYNASSYTLKLYKNNTLYNTYNMNAQVYTVRGLPSGEYYAALYAKNTNTGEEHSIRCENFKIVDTYTVSYNANGGKNAPTSQTKIEDTSLTLTSSIPSREGYIFKGWASSKNATEAQYHVGDSYTKNAKITLYAVWEPEIYTVSFDTNGGVGIVENQTITYGNMMKMPNTIVKDYSYLIGWSTDKNATKPEYSLGVDYKIKGNLKLYAVWGNATWSNEVSKSLKGSGTETDPYLISTAADLAYLANKVNTQTGTPTYEYYKMTDNINLAYNEWVPIGIYGNENQYFYGSFNGNGYTISDLYITQANQNYVGLFGYVKDSEIKNLTVTGAIESIETDAKDLNIGGIVGYATGTKLTVLCVKYFNIGDISIDSGTSYVGTIIGESAKGTIDSCKSEDCHINVKAGDHICGMIGGDIDGSLIKNCSVNASEYGLFSASSTKASITMGGICGRTWNLGGEIKDCTVYAPYFSNSLKVNGLTCGGIIGYSRGSCNVKTCMVRFFSNAVNSMTLDTNLRCCAGGIVGNQWTGTISDCVYDGGSIVANNCSKWLEIGGLIGESYSWNDGRTAVERCVANVDGIISGNTSDAPEYGYCYVGGGIGTTTYTRPPQDHSLRLAYAKDLIVFADKVNANTPIAKNGSAGSIVGSNYDNTFTFENAYYNFEMNVTSSTGNVDTTGIARSKKTMNTTFYTNILGLTPYSSLQNLENDEKAVWVLKNGELPELYYNCLNDITVSGNIENGTITIDKTQAIDGESVTITAVPNENYVLNKIYVNGKEIPETSFTVSGDSEVFATFNEKVAEYNVSVTADENATATIANVDAAVPMLMSIEDNSSPTTTMIAKDGEEIMVTTNAADDYTVDAIYVNGEEVAGNSFVLTDNSNITMKVTNISTEIKATTNDTKEVGSYFAIVSGSIENADEDTVKYIRYWSADDTETIYTTTVETGIGDYTTEIMDLKPSTMYYYQMTEQGEIKSFTTMKEENDTIDEDSDEYNNENGSTEESKNTEPITSTTYKKLTSTYKFTIEATQALKDEAVFVAAYNDVGRMMYLKNIECDGDTSYQVSFPIDNEIDYVKIFVWKNTESMIPIAAAETIELK